MKDNIKKLWVKALRSGEYKQGKGALVVKGKQCDSFCCLGVLTDLYVRQTKSKDKNVFYHTYEDTMCDNLECCNPAEMTPDSRTELHEKVMKWAGLNDGDPEINGVELSVYNDGPSRAWLESAMKVVGPEGWSFKKIADLIEKNL
jgi:hypothetical protein